MTQTTKRRLLYHFITGHWTRRNKDRSLYDDSEYFASSCTKNKKEKRRGKDNSQRISTCTNNKIKTPTIEDNRIHSLLHHHNSVRYFNVIVLSATIILTVILPLCMGTATASALASALPYAEANPLPVPIRVSHSYAKTNDNTNNHNTKNNNNYTPVNSNDNNKNANNANAPQQQSSISRPFYTKVSMKENAVRPNYLFATRNPSTSTSRSHSGSLFRDETSSTVESMEDRPTEYPISMSKIRFSLDPLFNFLSNFPSLASSTESSSASARAPVSEALTSEKTVTPTVSSSKNATKTKSKGKRAKNKITTFAVQLSKPIVTTTTTTTTSKPTLHPLSVLETEMVIRTSTPPPKAEPLVAPSLHIEDITQPTSGPYPDSGRSNSGPTLLSFDKYEGSSKMRSNNGTGSSRHRNKSGSKKSDLNILTSTTMRSYSPVEPKHLRSNFFDNFHDQEIDNIAEETGDAPEVMVAGESGPSGTGGSGSGPSAPGASGSGQVNIPAGFAVKPPQGFSAQGQSQSYNQGQSQGYNQGQSPGSAFRFGADSATAPPRSNIHSYGNAPNKQQLFQPGVHLQHQQYPSHHPNHFQHPLHHPNHYQYQHHRLPIRPPLIMNNNKLRPNLQSYYDDSYHKYTAASENQYENYAPNGFGTRPLPPHGPPFHSPHHNPNHIHQPHNFPLHHHPPHGTHYYGHTLENGNSDTGPSAPSPSPQQPQQSESIPVPIQSYPGNEHIDNSAVEYGHSGTGNSGPGQSGPSGSGAGLSAIVLSGFDSNSASSGSSGVHSNQKISIMDSFDVFYKEYKLLTWAVFFVVTSLALLSVLVYLYVNNPPTEVVTARYHLKDLMANPQLLKFMTNLVETIGGNSSSSNNNNSRSSRSKGRSRTARRGSTGIKKNNTAVSPVKRRQDL